MGKRQYFGQSKYKPWTAFVLGKEGDERAVH